MRTKTTAVIKAAFVLAAMIVLSSCDSNEVDPFGSGRLKVVNAAPDSGSQKFILANIPYIGNLSYKEHSVSYHKVAVGNNLVAQYRDEGDNDLYASQELDLDDDKTYTVYLTGGSRSDAGVRLFEDNLSAPSSGKAKVKFLHLSDAGPSSINFTDAAGISLSGTLARYTQSSYAEVNAGVLAIHAHSSGATADLALLESNFQDGKIYTVYISGNASSGYSIEQILHN
ncbi:DUF4397 domain-containing protein [Flavobacterium gelatinilyticum]|uniref:DUF4397 domain-containing protein n=1 Tax=Flavobacterium gelatinilyticum TaxID=3003260 RepID=UPI0024808A11|nr:DUF4397 domain-containing protein [Flavobacterium gelatinilyticum]